MRHLYLTSFLTILSLPTLAGVNSVVTNPVSAWLVGPSEIKIVANASATPGCSMIAEFDNGRMLGLHARQNGISGLTLDTRLNTLAKGKLYPVTITLDGGDVTLNGQANDSSTLSVDLRALGSERLGTKFSQSGSLSIRLGNEPITTNYSTKGLNDGMVRLQTCLDAELADASPALVQPTKMSILSQELGELNNLPTRSPQKTKTDVINSYPIPPIPSDMLDETQISSPKTNINSDNTPQSGTLMDAIIALLPPGTKFSITGVDPMQKVTWQKTETNNWESDLEKTLNMANMQFNKKNGRIFIISAKTTAEIKTVQPATIAPVNSEISKAKTENLIAEKQPILAESNKSWEAKKGERLVDVLARWARQDGITSRLDVPASFIIQDNLSISGPLNVAVAAVLEPFKGQNGAPQAEFSTQNNSIVTAPIEQTMWRGASGAPLRDVLTAWGNQAGVDVIWDADVLFDLRNSIRSTAPFETVIQNVMDQYAQDDIRPQATLNTDPQTGKKSLVIQAIGS